MAAIRIKIGTRKSVMALAQTEEIARRLTAAVPGRSGVDFRERVAWLDSGRVLAIPLPAGIRQNVANLGLFVFNQTLAMISKPMLRSTTW